MLAERLTGMCAAREVITLDENHSVRWTEHDYPTPVARWNYHPEYEIHLIRRGTGRFIVGDHVGTFAAGHVSLIGSGLPHDWVSDLEPGEVITNRDAVIQIDPAWIARWIDLMPEAREIRPLLDESARGVEFAPRTALLAAPIINRIGPATGLERVALLVELLKILARSPRADRTLLATEFFRPQLDDRAAAIVDIVLEYAFAGHAGQVSVAEAADLVGMHEATFSKYFKKATGQNLSELIRKLRIAHAGRLLTTTSLPIASVCFEVGYANLSNFNRQFLAEKGVTPRQYRQDADKRPPETVSTTGPTP
ncbi:MULTISPECIES: AraC family transcriptional regulator [unclassified Rathayibacter]|uniref:AraC family transcriptional regulator n=1 Tax=unclassified Rathayibacter TaxID=2609250 RepID=UPI001FB4FD34|nr:MULTISPECIES: AraC family transcriptional regulator [unclassified Rathayibacter]MCJ1674621.1 AraC family transcriptional regulator [Rathayibacter sp. VKM Ac-2929]MCJ1682730.1 AraC family transcriptional regulator [Rathayibacter sp. VKM Ac-2928]